MRADLVPSSTPASSLGLEDNEINVALDLENTIEDNESPTALERERILMDSATESDKILEALERQADIEAESLEQVNLSSMHNTSWGFEPWQDILSNLRDWGRYDADDSMIYMLGEHFEPIFEQETHFTEEYGNQWIGFFTLMDQIFKGNPTGFELFDPDTAYYLSRMGDHSEAGNIDIVTGRTDAWRFHEGKTHSVSDELYGGMSDFLEHAGILYAEKVPGFGAVDGFYVSPDKPGMLDENGEPMYQVFVDDSPRMLEERSFPNASRPDQVQVLPEREYTPEDIPRFSEVSRADPFGRMKQEDTPRIVVDNYEDSLSYFGKLEDVTSLYIEAMAKFRR
jgi:hypothetical protein